MIPGRLDTISVGRGSVRVEREGAAATDGVTFTVGATGKQDDGACLKLALGADLTSLTIEGDVRLGAAGTEDFDVLTVNGDASGELGVHVVGNKLEFEEDVAQPDGTEMTKLTSANRMLDGSFHRLRFAMARPSASATMRTELSVDGVLAATYEAVPAVLNGSPALELGDCTLNDSKSWRVHLDNVVVDAN